VKGNSLVGSEMKKKSLAGIATALDKYDCMYFVKALHCDLVVFGNI
jgi:hypothetical protein